MKKTIRLTLFVVLLACISVLGIDAAFAADYPDRAVTLVTWSSPGGGGDIVSRKLGDIVAREKLFPQPIVVENRLGGQNINALNYVANARPDGYTMLFVTRNLVISPYANARPDLNYEAFTPIIGLTTEPFFIIVRGDAKWKTLEELIEDAKANPNQISWAGAGFSDKVVCDKIQEATGADFNYVQYEGGGELIAAIMGKHVDIITTGPPESISFVEAGEMVYLANVDNERSSMFPDVPTTTELGYDIGAQDNWRGIVVPKGTPDEVVALLHKTFKAATETEEWAEFCDLNVLEMRYNTPEGFYEKVVIPSDGPSRKMYE